MAMEPKPPQGARLPIWVGGTAPRALQRVAELGDGWLASGALDAQTARQQIAKIREMAWAADRDPDQIGLQIMLDVPPTDESGKGFYKDADRVVARAVEVAGAGFQYGALNATALFQAGYRSTAALADQLAVLHERLRAELDRA